MRIVVTGNRGTLGTPLVEQLKKNGHEVFGIDLAHSHDPNYMRADVSNIRELRLALSKFKPDLVYHLAAEFGRFNGEDYYEQLWTTNAIGTKHVLTVQKELGFKLIFASSSEVYGESNLDVLPETVPDELPVRYFNDYAITKRVNEMQIQNAIERDGSQTMILRFFNAYGPGELYHRYRSVVCLFCYSALNNMPITVYEDYKRVFIYIDDFIPTVARACEKFVSGGIFNIGGSEYRPIGDLAKIVTEAVPTYPKNLVQYMRKESMNVANKRPDITKAIAQFGHDPKIPLEEGVLRTLAWMRQVYKK
jgi:dTDP-glucose 4,6-dehydratase